MILDFDYLPLPLAGAQKKKAAAKNEAANRAKLFQQKDINKDGVLSWEEFSQGRDKADAEGWFKARDKDANGTLSKEEFVTAKVGNPPKKR